MTDTPARTSARALVIPVPTWSFSILAGSVNIFLLGGAPMVLDIGRDPLIEMAINVVGSVVIYIALLCLCAGGDPRVWRYPAQIRRLMATDRPVDDDEVTVMRAHVWREGSSAMGRQMGCITGVMAGMCLAARSEGLAVLATILIGGAVWLLTSMLVSAPDRAELAPWIDRADAVAGSGQSDAGT
jgi:hypothetical protein